MSIIFFSSHIVYAKYVTVDKLSSINNIGKPVFIVESKETVKISKINNIGYYEFSIKNFNDTNVSEIGFLYTIEIITNINEAIKFELYQESSLIPLENLKTRQLSINGNEKIEQKYKLKVIYDAQKGTNGEDILEEVQIKVHSEQEKK